MYKIVPKKRYDQTIKLVEKFFVESDQILDLGIQNPLSEMIKEKGFDVVNTAGEDLDEKYMDLKRYDVNGVTAFEILEHLLNPYSLLRHLPGDKLLATVPLDLWFAKTFRNPENIRAQHFHEFRDWQFDWLLDKTGWEIKHREKWTNPSKKIGIRPVLRSFTPRYYAVYAERKIKI